MNTLYSGILSIIRAAVTEKPMRLPDGFSLSDAAAIARNHQCESMLYYGAELCGVPKDDPVMQSLMERLFCFYAANESQKYEINRLCAQFEAHGVSYLPLKGAVLKTLYPKEDMRTMSDVDILIHLEQIDKIKSLLHDMGFTYKQESAHELIFVKKQLKLELHKSLIPPYHTDLYSFLGDGWSLARPSAEGSCLFELSQEDTYLYLFAHFAKHYRDGGIGLRHVVDLWVWRNAHPDMDQKIIDEALTKLKLSEFHNNIIQMLHMWFDDQPATEKTEYITSFIFSSGSYGQTALRSIGTASVNAKDATSPQQIKRQNVCQLLFPPKSLLLNDYPILNKHGWLLPGVWGVRAFKALFIKGSVPSQARRLKRIRGSSIREFRQSLDYVGLTYTKEVKS